MGTPPINLKMVDYPLKQMKSDYNSQEENNEFDDLKLPLIHFNSAVDEGKPTNKKFS